MRRYLRQNALYSIDAASLAGFDGLVLGSEFCGFALPALEEMEKARELCEGLGKAFVPVTPVTREGEFDRVAAWLERVLDPGGEWIANDVGLLKWALERGVGGRVVAGRMLSRQQRGPRLSGMLDSASSEVAVMLKGSMWDDPEALELFAALGVYAVELDALPWGIVRPPLPEGFELHVTAPWAAVSWSPWCFSGTGLEGFCAAPCLAGEAMRLENDEDPTPLWAKGNATLMRVGVDEAEKAAADAKADRLVWSPAIPL